MPSFKAGTGSIMATVAAAASAVQASSQSLADLCTASNIQSALPANGTLLGIDLLPSSVVANTVYNATVGGGSNGGVGGADASGTYSYCNVTLSYVHTGRDDEPIALLYALPSPSDFASRYYTAGGGGFSLSSDATGGLPYGAVSGASDAGYGALSGTAYDEVVLYGNGSVNWDATYMFGYQALGELVQVGKALATNVYDADKIYTYFEGCSDGGREGMSQVQRYGAEYDGVVAGAPAFRFSQQQVHHLLSSWIESQKVGYAPPSCELDKIVNATISACDKLDGREDGVVSRTDLCMLNFDLESLVGTPYSCAASSGGGGGPMKKAKRQMGGGSATPAQNGTITKEGIAVAQGIYDGLHNSKGERAYLSWQIASKFGDATPTWDADSETWEIAITTMGGEYVAKFVQLLDLDNLSTLDGVTADTLTEWMRIGMDRFYDSVQTTYVDLSDFRDNGGKLLHYHGESDSSIPSASSVHYWQAVRDVMYPSPAAASAPRDPEELAEWYQLYLVPGAEHCGTNTLQPGPFPTTNMDIMIDWVENGNQPTALNATTDSGDYEGETQMLCRFPKRPLWKSETEFDCVIDEASIESWTYQFDAFKTPVY